MLRTVFTLLLVTTSIYVKSQKEISWKTLSDVNFVDKYFELEGGYYLHPKFGESVKALEGTEVYLKGYILALDPETGYYLLSSNPYSSCFFCGGAGPETVVELEFRYIPKRLEMDQVVTIRGKLKLNSDNIYQCNYIFEEADLYEPYE